MTGDVLHAIKLDSFDLCVSTFSPSSYTRAIQHYSRSDSILGIIFFFLLATHFQYFEIKSNVYLIWSLFTSGKSLYICFRYLLGDAEKNVDYDLKIHFHIISKKSHHRIELDCQVSLSLLSTLWIPWISAQTDIFNGWMELSWL